MQTQNIKTLLSLAMTVIVWLLPNQAIADEKYDSAFRSSGLPWYDAETKGLKQSTAPARGESQVSDRNRIPGVKPVKKGQQVTKPATAPAPAAGTGSFFGTVGTTIIYVVGGILALVLIGLLIYGFLKLEGDDGDAEETVGNRKRKIRDHIRHLPFEIEEQDGDFESIAERFLREGNYSKAVIYLFADMLAAMSESGIVRLQRGKTNRQYLNEIWDHGEIRPYYRKVMTAFEDAFFGQHEIEQNRAEECFAERPAFNAALEKIKTQRFAAAQPSAVMPSPKMGVEGAS